MAFSFIDSLVNNRPLAATLRRALCWVPSVLSVLTAFPQVQCRGLYPLHFTEVAMEAPETEAVVPLGRLSLHSPESQEEDSNPEPSGFKAQASLSITWCCLPC